MAFEKIENKRLFFSWIGALVIVTALLILKGANISVQFTGIIEPGEIIINRDRAVIIRKINAIPGQKVGKEFHLLELENPDLNFKINQVTLELEKLLQEYRLNNNMRVSSEIIEKGAGKPSSGGYSLIDIKIGALTRELDFLKKEKERMKVITESPCTIVAVNYKAGETAAPYTAIMTIINEAPAMVKGYVLENLNYRLSAGDGLFVQSLYNSGRSVTGTVLSSGIKLVMIPDRLNPNPMVKLWGREVVIAIPPGNPFMFDEKVLISSHSLGILNFIR